MHYYVLTLEIITAMTTSIGLSSQWNVCEKNWITNQPQIRCYRRSIIYNIIEKQGQKRTGWNIDAWNQESFHAIKKRGPQKLSSSLVETVRKGILLTVTQIDETAILFIPLRVKYVYGVPEESETYIYTKWSCKMDEMFAERFQYLRTSVQIL